MHPAEETFFKEHPLHAEGHRIDWYRLEQWLMMDRLAIVLEEPIAFPLRAACYCCGEDVPMHYNGKEFQALSACRYRFGGIPHVFFLKVPSGAIAVANDLRRLIAAEEPDHYVNHAIGRVNLSLWYAEQGMAHASVGNTCPSLYQVNDEHYQIMSRAFDDEDYINTKPLANICTDLWWYSIMDWGDFAEKSEEDGAPWGMSWKDYVTRVEIKPGLWRFTHHVEESDFDRDSPMDLIFTDITWVADA